MTPDSHKWLHNCDSNQGASACRASGNEVPSLPETQPRKRPLDKSGFHPNQTPIVLCTLVDVSQQSTHSPLVVSCGIVWFDFRSGSRFNHGQAILLRFTLSSVPSVHCCCPSSSCHKTRSGSFHCTCIGQPFNSPHPRPCIFRTKCLARRHYLLQFRFSSHRIQPGGRGQHGDLALDSVSAVPEIRQDTKQWCGLKGHTHYHGQCLQRLQYGHIWLCQPASRHEFTARLSFDTRYVWTRSSYS